MNQFLALVQIRQRHVSWVLVLVSAVVAALAYLQALDYPIMLDDGNYTVANAKLLALPLAELWRLFIEPYNNMSEFLPVRDFSYWLDMTLFGITPPVFRATNIVLYLFCLPLIYSITLKLWRLFRVAGHSGDTTSAPWVAALVTALFAVNPSHVEAVVWIAGRKDVLAGLFSLLALWLALAAKRKHGLSAPHAAASLLVLLLAMLSKATAIAMAPIIAMLWVIFWRDLPQASKHRSLLLWPLFGLLIAACFALIFASMATSKVPLYFGVEAVTRSFAVLGWLVRLAVTPESRHFIYPVFEDPWLPFMVSLGEIALVAAGVGGLILFSGRFPRSKYSIEGFSLVFFLLLCLPSLQLVPYLPPSLVSDRFVFLAVWPVTLLIVALAWRLKPVPRIALLLVIALLWCFQTVERPRDWRDYETLIETDLQAYPGNYILAMYKIYVQLNHGLFQDAVETANSITIPEFRDDMLRLTEAAHAVRIGAVATGKPDNAMSLLKKLGVDIKQLPLQAKWNSPIHNFWRMKRTVITLEWKNLVERFPGDVPVLYGAGLWMLEATEYKDAEVYLLKVIESQSLQQKERGTAFYSLGYALIGGGKIAEAEVPLRAALEQSPPDLRAYCLLSAVYEQTNRNDKAMYAAVNCPNRRP